MADKEREPEVKADRNGHGELVSPNPGSPGPASIRARRLKEIYELVVEQDPAEWRGLLDRYCADDPSLRAEVVELLRFLPQAEKFIERPLTEDRELFTSIVESIAVGRRIGNYQILEEIGQGGMGAVYRAIRADREYTSEVAIKLVWPGFDKDEVLREFRKERQILAGLNHPHIARLLDGGTTEEGWPYFVMEYVDGQPLTSYCNDRRLSIAARLQLFEQVCDAVGYAHQQKIVHRDLKPGNIFVTDRRGPDLPEVKLLDFGIAKILDPTAYPERQSMTQTRLQAMTPEYASPEQVKGREVAPSSDIYSLGVVLYELLTGVHPVKRFSQEPRSLHETFQAICNDEVVQPSRIWSIRRPDGPDGPDGQGGQGGESRSTPSIQNEVEPTPGHLRKRLAGDLDAIILKAMRQAPSERYATADELADDLRRFREGRPVLARRGAWGYGLRKFIRRHRLTLFVVGLFLLVSAIIGSVALYREYQRWWQSQSERRQLYARRLRIAQEALTAGDVERFEGQLNEVRAEEYPADDTPPGFEWRHLWNLIHRERFSFSHANDIIYFFDYNEKGLVGTVDCQQILDDNNLRLRFEGCTFHLWDSRSGAEVLKRPIEQPLRSLIFIHNGALDNGGRVKDLLVLYGDGAKQVWDLDSADPAMVRRSLMTGYSPVRILSNQLDAWETPDGNLVLNGIFNDQPVAVLPVNSHIIDEVIRPESGGLVLVKEEFNQITAWDLPSKRILSKLELQGQISQVMPDWKTQRLITLSGGQKNGQETDLSVWDLRSLRKIGSASEQTDPVAVFQVLPNSNRLVAGLLSGRITIRELPTLRQMTTFNAHEDWINDLLVPGDESERLYLTASNDQTVRIWEAESNRLLTELRGHRGDVTRLIMSNDGKSFLSSSRDRTLKMWDLERVLEPSVVSAHDNNIYTIAYSADGKLLASGSEDGTAKVWEAATGRLLSTLRSPSKNVLHVAFSPTAGNGAPPGLLATAGADGVVRLWETGSWQQVRQLTGHSKQIHELTFSPDGRWLATASDDMTVRIWDPWTGSLIRVMNGYSREVFAVAFSPDGRRLATGGWESPVLIRNVETGEIEQRLEGHSGTVWSVQFAPDGLTLASAGEDKTIILWDARTGEKRQVMRGHFNEIFSLAFTPDGTRIASASNDKTVRLWEPQSGRERFQFSDHTSQVYAVTFSPDGQRLASGSWDRTVRFYTAATAEQIKRKAARRQR
jgi:WD40 repeat protein/serine/threonine protein kinase